MRCSSPDAKLGVCFHIVRPEGSHVIASSGAASRVSRGRRLGFIFEDGMGPPEALEIRALLSPG